MKQRERILDRGAVPRISTIRTLRMEIIWHILLTVCSGTTCLEQDVQQFETKAQCKTMLVEYTEMPADGHWDTVKYICKPLDSVSL